MPMMTNHRHPDNPYFLRLSTDCTAVFLTAAATGFSFVFHKQCGPATRRPRQGQEKKQLKCDSQRERRANMESATKIYENMTSSYPPVRCPCLADFIPVNDFFFIFLCGYVVSLGLMLNLQYDEKADEKNLLCNVRCDQSC
jgi:hypothetical protein